MDEKRDQLWNDLKQKWDMVIVGGGITGAGIFREAVRMGLKTLLVERKDFAWGTSSRSSKLVHGGLRYLKEGQLLLTRESVVERERLLAESQQLVLPLHFLFPDYEGVKPGRWTLEAGLAVYDMIAGNWDHKYLKSPAFNRMAPHLKVDGLHGGLRYKDARTDDARLVLRLLFEGRAYGGVAMNYVSARPPQTETRVAGLELVNELTQETFFVNAGVVVNATGVWADRLRSGKTNCLRPLRGSHLVFPSWRVPCPQAITLPHPRDRRPAFMLPWEGATIFGTTDMDHKEDLDLEAAITQGEVTYLMEALQHYLPGLNLVEDDIMATFAGVRPVISDGSDDPSKASRDHKIWDDNGLLTITGGKLTTFRHMAFDLLKKARPYLPPEARPNPKAPVFDPVPLRWTKPLSEAVAQRLSGRYGAAAEAMVAGASAQELEPVPGTDTLWLELRHAARNELVVHLEDLILRRVRLGLLAPHGARDFLPRIGAICQEELGWSQERLKDEENAWLQLYQRCYSLPGR